MGKQGRQEQDGLVLEQWILRSMLAAVAGLLIASVASSVDDIKRYIRIKRM